MRSFRHWTPRYIINRLAEMHYQRSFPDHPWLTRQANEILGSYLKNTDVGVEFGSGRSTLWFAQRVGHLTSVEHNEAWFQKVQQMLKERRIENVEYHLIPLDRDEDDARGAAYVRILDKFGPDSLDFALVDGMYRDYCALELLGRIRPGGLMVIDNVNWYLPHVTHSPASRTPADGPKGPTWAEVHRNLQSWRQFWTTSGVTDTAFFIRPCA